MKRYWVFEFDKFYPRGGMADFVRSCGSLEESIESVDAGEDKYRLAHVFDSLECRVAWRSLHGGNDFPALQNEQPSGQG